MYSIINDHQYNFDYKLYKELESDGEKAKTVDDEGNVILTHYWKDKIIPPHTKTIN